MLRYDASDALKVLPEDQVRDAQKELLESRTEVFRDAELWAEKGSQAEAETGKSPLDAGFLMWPQEQLAKHQADPGGSLVGQIQAAAAALQAEADRFVVLGIGGSYMGARAMFESLCVPYHNELPSSARQQNGTTIPRIYFEGNNLDNDTTSGLLDLLSATCKDTSDRDQRWALTVISKSGGTLETAVAFRLFRQALENYYGADSDLSQKLVVPITGETGKLRNLSNERGYPTIFPIPDGIGGRFSVLTAVGLLPAAVMGIDLVELLQGAADITEQFRTAGPNENPVLDYTAVCHVAENHGLLTRVLSTWGGRLESVGLWYDQLLAESLGKEDQGALPLTVVNTRDLHSRGQQHQEGCPDKLFTNLIVEEPSSEPLGLPEATRNEDELNQHAGKTMPRFLRAAIEGTNQAYREVERPTADLILPKLDAYHLGQTFQMLMLATVLEGQLIEINPYGQPGVEAYKKFMKENLQSD